MGALRLLEKRASHAAEHTEVFRTPHININGAYVAFAATRTDMQQLMRELLKLKNSKKYSFFATLAALCGSAVPFENTSNTLENTSK